MTDSALMLQLGGPRAHCTCCPHTLAGPHQRDSPVICPQSFCHPEAETWGGLGSKALVNSGGNKAVHSLQGPRQ